MTLSEGDNINIPYGYTIQSSDIGRGSSLVIRGLCESGVDEWSNRIYIISSKYVPVNLEHNLSYSDGMFGLSLVDLSAQGFYSNNLYIEIDKLTSNNWANVALGNVNIDTLGNGRFLFNQITLRPDLSDEYVKIEVYKDSVSQDLIKRQFISPANFEF